MTSLDMYAPGDLGPEGKRCVKDNMCTVEDIEPECTMCKIISVEASRTLDLRGSIKEIRT